MLTTRGEEGGEAFGEVEAFGEAVVDGVGDKRFKGTKKAPWLGRLFFFIGAPGHSVGRFIGSGVL